MIYTDIAIVGGGAAGLFAAAYSASAASSEGAAEIVVFEKMPRPGRKIGLTGKGRCNLTNTKPWEEFRTHIHPKPDFFRNAFYGCSNRNVMDFFSQTCGLPLVEERGERVFPASMRAIDVIDALVEGCKRAGVRIVTDSPLSEIVRLQDLREYENLLPDALAGSYRYLLLDREQKPLAAAKSVIVATGGLSYPSTGSTGDGYRFAEALGHTVTPLFPSLTALQPEGYSSLISSLQLPIHLKNVAVTLIADGNEVASEFGELDFTDGGIEGPIGYKVSRKAVETLQKGKVLLRLDLKPAVTRSQVTERLKGIIEKSGRGRREEGKELFPILREVMPHALIPLFTGMHPNLQRDADQIAKSLKSWQFKITGYVGYNRAVVTAGGVSLSELSPKSLESKRSPGLYFVGEVLDMDCDTGGYNLQMAFSTGALAISAALKDLRK